MNMRRNKIAAGLVVVAVGVGGVGTPVAPPPPPTTYKLSADKSKLKFNVSTIRAKAGKVTLRMANPSSIPHAVGVQGRGKGKTVTKGGTSTYSVTLKKGNYTFYCPVGSHAKAGMKGKLIVN
jgi:plastocyanin